MAVTKAASTPPAEISREPTAAELLGGAAVLGGEIENRLDAHVLILKGLPGEALARLLPGA